MINNSYHPKVAVVVPAYNRKDLTLRFIANFKQQKYQNYQIIIVDDNSVDGTADAVKERSPEVLLLRGDGNYWWTGCTNLGVKYAIENSFDYVLTINEDTTVQKDYLEKLLACAKKNPKYIVGSSLTINNTNQIWALGASINYKTINLFSLNYGEQDLNKVYNIVSNPLRVTLLTGNGTLVPVEAYKSAGLYNAIWFPQYHADSEFILRATKKGFIPVVCLDAVATNHITGKPLVTTKSDMLLSKKSDLYWRPIMALYLKYAPWRYKLYFFKQFYNIFRDALIFKVSRKIYRRIKNKPDSD